MKFTITESAGDWVAGMKSPGVGKVIELTAAQAEYELLRGVIRPVVEEEKPQEELVIVPPLNKGKKK